MENPVFVPPMITAAIMIQKIMGQGCHHKKVPANSAIETIWRVA
jgi:hypothetical protein